MIEFLSKNSIYATLINSIKPHEKLTVFGCDLDAKLTILNDTGKFLLFVTSDVKEAVNIKEKLTETGYKVESLTEKLNYNLNPFDNEYNEKVLKVLNKVLNGEIDALIVNPMFLYYKLPNVEWLRAKTIHLSSGVKKEPDELVKQLVNAGFTREEYVEKDGQFSLKGDCVEFVSGEAYRVYFDFDAIEKIKVFNIETRINEKDVDEINIGNACWIENTEDIIKSVKDDEEKQKLVEFEDKLNNMIWCSPFCEYINDNIVNYLPEDAVVCFTDNKLTYTYLQEEVKEYNKCMLDMPAHKKMVVKDVLNLGDVPVVGFQYITNSNRLFTTTKVFNLKCVPVPNYRGQYKLLGSDLSNLKSKKYTIVIYVKNKEGYNRISTLLEANNLTYNNIGALSFATTGEINLVTKRFGMSVNLELDKVLVLGSGNLFGVAKPILKASAKNETSDFLPQTGDYVVHNTYGIGKCLGVERLTLSKSARDYVIVEYKNSDKLYLPVENIDSLSRFVGEDNPPLNKLGSTEFLKTKEKVKANVKKLAINLAKLYSERESMKGYVYPNDDDIIKQFEDSFGYVETPDQAQAVLDIKTDMMKGKIMDRLICGDVGFGKTEVALRGAFKTIMAGKQVAFLCPTTILSEQHYNTCVYRMKDFGVNVAVLNRFCSAKKVAEVEEGLKNGDIDIVVGTHKLLNKNIQFKNLGLLILDEEQKFGVGDKEKIKELKKNINVLTLSATPIPRTLNMALMGVRDISIIDTPPVSRIPTLVRVQEYSDELLKAAVDAELERGGQVLIIYNRVETIFEFAAKVKAMFPNATVDVTHGQMEQQKLEDAIVKLYNNETQILISTTLIENGVDLPNANTLFVINADMLGLSQLYQLKGRVGRSDRQAFAFFTFSGNKELNETAYKRLEALSEYTSMGSGYKIALRDLEIRGAGKIFGAEQSGHIEKVGYAMYLKLLSEAVGELKGEKIAQVRDVKIETQLDAFLPYDYIERHDLRMSSYVKISKISTPEELQKVVNELTETYGEVPQEVFNLCKIALIKNLASTKKVSRVVVRATGSQIYFYDDINLSAVSLALESFNLYMVLDVQNKPIINIKNIVDMKNALNLIINFLEILAN